MSAGHGPLSAFPRGKAGLAKVRANWHGILCQLPGGLEGDRGAFGGRTGRAEPLTAACQPDRMPAAIGVFSGTGHDIETIPAEQQTVFAGAEACVIEGAPLGACRSLPRRQGRS
jgi:hypothetical protein